MTIQNILISDWVLNIPALVIAACLVSFHLVTGRFRFGHNSPLFYAGVAAVPDHVHCHLWNSSDGIYLFSAHMTQHIFYLLIIPPLLLAGTDSEFLHRLQQPARVHHGPRAVLPAGHLDHGHRLHVDMAYPGCFSRHEAIAGPDGPAGRHLLVLGYIFIWPVFAPVRFMKLGPLESTLYLFSACVGCTVLGHLYHLCPVGYLYGVFHRR